MITVTILDDTVPEDEKTVVVQLSNPVGGASISNGTATIVILPNDNVAGVLALDKTSVLANEGMYQYILYKNIPMKYTEFSEAVKIKKFHLKILVIFLVFA